MHRRAVEEKIRQALALRILRKGNSKGATSMLILQRSWSGGTFVLIVLAYGLLPRGLVPAVRADVVSGPPEGEPTPGLSVVAVSGLIEDKQVDYVAERKGKPTVYVFVPSVEGRLPVGGRPVARFLRELDRAIGEFGQEAYSVAVWLTDAPETTKEYLPVVQKVLQLQRTGLAYYADGANGPLEWGLNADANATVVIVHQNKTAAAFGLEALSETDVRRVMEGLKKAVKP
jgi:hypothetical protein